MTAGNSHRATREQGPSVVDGRLRWTSATGITTADPNSFGGCLRKWWYDTVAGEKAPATKAMEAGTELHTEVENHLRFGTSLQTPLALSGGMFIPHPGSGLDIERAIHFTTSDALSDGVDIFGHVDLYNFRQEYIDPDGELQRDPAWSFEVKDWKTTSDFQYAKSEHELKENIQLVTYAEAGFRFAPDMEHARLTHVYFRTRGAPASKLVTVRRTRDEIAARWQYAESVVRTMADVAREPTGDHVPGKRSACDAYRGCPHRSQCSVYKFDALDNLYGKIATDHSNSSPGWGVEPAQPKGTEMGLLANQPGIMNQQQAQPAVDMRAQLEAEEARQRQAVAQQQQQMPQQLNTAELQQVCIRLQGYGYGFPTLAGNAAQAYAVIGGQSIAPGSTYPGLPAVSGARRSLHGIQLTEVAHIYQLEGELAKELAAAQPTPQAAPPVAPQPAVYTPPVYKAMDAPGLSFLPPDAPQSMPQLAMAGGPAQNGIPVPASVPPPGYFAQVPPAQVAPDPMLAVPEAKPSRGRPKKVVQDVAPGSVAAGQPQAVPPPSSPPAPATQAAPVSTSPIPTTNPRGSILINARFADKPTKSLAPYVDYINGELSKRYCVTADGKPGVQDVRCAPKDSVLAFGGWRGAVREIVKADPPPFGNWHLDLFRDELNEVVADALRVVAEQLEWTYVRGVTL